MGPISKEREGKGERREDGEAKERGKVASWVLGDGYP